MLPASDRAMLSIIPFDRVTAQTTQSSERPFKAYPRAPLPSSFSYGPFAPPTFVGSISIPAAHTKRSTEVSAMDLRPQPHADPLPHLMDISQHVPSTRQSQVKMEHAGHMSQGQLQPSYPNVPMPQHAPQHHGHNGNGHMDRMDRMDPSQRSPNQQGSPKSDDGNGENFKMPPKKRPHNVPDTLKDAAYWEKRKKNNDSAKRSRDARRMKEEQIAMRVVYLEQENLQLRTEVSLLKSEIEKLRCMLYNS